MAIRNGKHVKRVTAADIFEAPGNWMAPKPRRVELPAWSDRWMMGDRYGVIERTSERKSVSGSVPITIAHVRLDISGKLVRFNIDDLRAL